MSSSIPRHPEKWSNKEPHHSRHPERSEGSFYSRHPEERNEME